MWYIYLYYIVIINKLPSVISNLQFQPVIPMRNIQKSNVRHIRQVEPMPIQFQNNRKPVCGPVLFPEISCEEPTSFDNVATMQMQFNPTLSQVATFQDLFQTRTPPGIFRGETHRIIPTVMFSRKLHRIEASINRPDLRFAYHSQTPRDLSEATESFSLPSERAFRHDPFQSEVPRYAPRGLLRTVQYKSEIPQDISYQSKAPHVPNRSDLPRDVPYENKPPGTIPYPSKRLGYAPYQGEQRKVPFRGQLPLVGHHQHDDQTNPHHRNVPFNNGSPRGVTARGKTLPGRYVTNTKYSEPETEKNLYSPTSSTFPPYKDNCSPIPDAPTTNPACIRQANCQTFNWNGSETPEDPTK